jgi:hypothetical protein
MRGRNAEGSDGARRRRFRNSEKVFSELNYPGKAPAASSNCKDAAQTVAVCGATAPSP